MGASCDLLRLAGWQAALILTVVIFGMGSIPALHWYYNEAQIRDWKQTARLLEMLVQPDDIIVTHAAELWGQAETSHLGYYYSGSEGSLVFYSRDELSVGMLEEAYRQHRRLWYVRRTITEDNLVEVEHWLEKNGFLTFSVDEIGIVISFKNRETASEEERRAEWADILQRAVAMNPDKWDLNKALSSLYIRQGEMNKAFELWTRFGSRHPGDPGAEVGLALVYQADGQTEEAWARLAKVLQTAPDDLRLYEALGNIYQARGGTEDALRQLYQQIESIDPAAAHFALALYYADQSQHPQAIQEFQWVIDSYPHHLLAQQARQWLGRYK